MHPYNLISLSSIINSYLIHKEKLHQYTWKPEYNCVQVNVLILEATFFHPDILVLFVLKSRVYCGDEANTLLWSFEVILGKKMSKYAVKARRN